MEKITVTLELPKEAYELFHGTFKLVESVKKSLDDGWQADQDLPVIVSEALVNLAPMINGFDKLPMEFKTDPANFINAGLISSANIVGLFVKSEPTV